MNENAKNSLQNLAEVFYYLRVQRENLRGTPLCGQVTRRHTGRSECLWVHKSDLKGLNIHDRRHEIQCEWDVMGQCGWGEYKDD